MKLFKTLLGFISVVNTVIFVFFFKNDIRLSLIDKQIKKNNNNYLKKKIVIYNFMQKLIF